MKTNWKLIAILVLVATAAAIHFANQPSTTPQSIEPRPQTPTTPQEPAEPAAQGPQTLEQTIRVHRLGYSPDTIEATQGDTLTLTIRSTDGREHGFAIADLEISQRITPGEDTTITIPTNRPGEYRIYSNVASHANSGNMRATLTIHPREQ